MQSPGRDGWTDAEITTLVRDEPAITIGRGCELLDIGLNVVRDISEDFVDGEVSRESYANIHGRATLNISQELPWGYAIVRPYMTVASDTLGPARFNLGAYLTNAPDAQAGETPATYSVEGIDILQALATPTGQSHSVAAGVSYLDEVGAILAAQGFTQFYVDPARQATTLAEVKVWPLDNATTWLLVINDLLGAVGYQGIYSDWDGVLQCRPYQDPSARASEWTYDSEAFSSMIGVGSTIRRDFFFAPNRWVAVRSNQIDGTTPTEGDGIYTFTNSSVGETSVDARGGRVITRILSIEAADQAALVTSAQITIDADVRVSKIIETATSPNPLHWHFDRITVDSTELGGLQEMIVTSWTLPLDGGDMTHRWAVVSGGLA